jgi:importin-5
MPAKASIPWPELLNALFQASRSEEPVQREAAFRIFKGTPGIIERQHEEIVISAFTMGFKDSDPSVCSFDMSYPR